MLSKAVTEFNRGLLTCANRRFAGSSKPFILNRIFNKVDTSTTAYNVAKYDPTQVLAGHKPLYTNEDAAEYNVTNLNNGFTVLTES